MTPERRVPRSKGAMTRKAPSSAGRSAESAVDRPAGRADARLADARLADASDRADPSAADRSARLTSLIRAEIESSPGRRIGFARYMERALYEPELGYYRGVADRPTDAGDFLTAPETHAIFGWTIARRIETMWAELGRPRPFELIEYGAGSGTLALSILDGLRRHGSADLMEAVRYQPVESNPHRLADLRGGFEKAGLAGLLALPGTRANETVPVTGVILANEFLDALPVHRVVARGGRLLELFVTCQESGGASGNVAGEVSFAEVAAEPSAPALAARLADDNVTLAEGQIGEICLGLDPWLDEVAKRLARGYILAIDYGFDAPDLYGPRRLAGTLLGYRGHRVEENPFAAPGLVDLTAHVDFTAVAQLAQQRGFRTVSSTTQSEFLVAAGLEEELRALQASPDLTLADYTRARSGIVRMLDPRHMGRFRVLTLRRDIATGETATPAR